MVTERLRLGAVENGRVPFDLESPPTPRTSPSHLPQDTLAQTSLPGRATGRDQSESQWQHTGPDLPSASSLAANSDSLQTTTMLGDTSPGCPQINHCGVWSMCTGTRPASHLSGKNPCRWRFCREASTPLTLSLLHKRVELCQSIGDASVFLALPPLGRPPW